MAFKMKGSPMQRNFAIGSPMNKNIDPKKVKQDAKDAEETQKGTSEETQALVDMMAKTAHPESWRASEQERLKRLSKGSGKSGPWEN